MTCADFHACLSNKVGMFCVLQQQSFLFVCNWDGALTRQVRKD